MAQKRDKLLVGALFGALLMYLLLRAWLVDPLHDEVATYFFYIYHGDFWGEFMVLDANNHLFNSVICHAIYHFFGDHFFLFRLPNVLAFCIYFYYAYRLSFQRQDGALRWLSLLALTGVPFVMEYFANCRGYGISLAGFIAALFHLLKYARQPRLIDMLALMFALAVSISSNASMLNTGLLVSGYLVVNALVNKPGKSGHLLLLIPFGAFLYFMVRFGLLLKASGALYYGNLDGLWDTTGASITKYTLFLTGVPAYILVLVLTAILLVTWILFFFKADWKRKLNEQFFLTNYLLFGNLLAILLLALLFQVNYPEDRVGMYFIPLFIFGFTYLLDQYKTVRALKWILLFFPLSFLWKMNLHTSVFSPDDRVSSEFYQAVKSKIRPEHSLMVYNTMYWDWTYFESHAAEKASMANSIVPNLALHDVILTRIDANTSANPLFADYEIIAMNKEAGHIAYKRKKQLDWALKYQSDPVLFSGQDEYLNIFETDSLSYLSAGAPVQVSIEGHLQTYDPKHYIQLVVQTFDASGNQLQRDYFPFDCVYQGKLINESFKHHFVIPKWNPQTAVLKVYLWNKGHHSAQGTNGKCYIYEVKSPENGTR